MINWARVEELREEVGADDFGEVVELFLAEVGEVISRLRDSPDRQTLEQELHFLKGSALNLGFAEFAALCHDGEQLSSNGRAEEVDLNAVIQTFEKAKSQFLNQVSMEANI